MINQPTLQAFDTVFDKFGSYWLKLQADLMGKANVSKPTIIPTVFMDLDAHFGKVRDWRKHNPGAVEVNRPVEKITDVLQTHTLPIMQYKVGSEVLNLYFNEDVTLDAFPKPVHPYVWMRLVQLELEERLGITPKSEEAEALAAEIRQRLRYTASPLYRSQFTGFLQLNVGAKRISGTLGGNARRVTITTPKPHAYIPETTPLQVNISLMGEVNRAFIGIMELNHNHLDFIDHIPFIASVEREVRATIQSFTGTDDDFGLSIIPYWQAKIRPESIK